MKDSSVTSPYKSLLIIPPPPPPRKYCCPSERHQLSMSTQSPISLGKTFLRVSVRIWNLAQTWISYDSGLFALLLSSAKFWTSYIPPSRSFIFMGVIHSLFAVSSTFQISKKSVNRYLQFTIDCETVGFFLKISQEIGKAWRKSLTRALCFQPCSRPFVWLLARTWIRKNTDCFAV